MACDSTEDKKHIDLSSEPLILVCAAGPRRVRPPTTWPRKWRSSGPTRRRRSSSPTTARPASRPTSRSAYRPSTPRSASCCRRWSATCSATRPRWRSTPRRARCARRARRSNSSSAQGLSGDEVVGRLNAELRLPAERFHDGLRSGTYDGHLEASTATRLSGLLRDVLSDRPIEQFQDLSGKVGTPQALIDDLVAGADQGDRGADPADRHDQAPGQDGHRRHLPQRRGHHRPPARAGGARRRCGTRRHQLSHDEGARRSRPGRGRGARATRATASTARSISIVDRGGISRDLPSRVERNSRAARHEAPGRLRARGARRRGPQRRAHAGVRARDQGRADHGHHAAARVVPRPAAGRRDARACCRATTGATTASSTGCRRPRAASTTRSSARSPSQELLIGPISDTADHWRP